MGFVITALTKYYMPFMYLHTCLYGTLERVTYLFFSYLFSTEGTWKIFCNVLV